VGHVMIADSYTSILIRAKAVLSGRPGSLGRPLSGLSDGELAHRCRRRDHEAFTEIVERYKDRVHWLVIRMVGGPNDEDLTQEVFLRAYQAIANFEGRSSLRTWLYRITHNLCVTELRKRGLRGEHLSIEEEGEEAVHRLLPKSGENFEAEIERYDLSQNLRNLIRQLPGNYRTVLSLFYLQQVKYEEIAEIMDIPLGTVKTHIHRARLRLRDLILDDPDIARSVGLEAADPEDGGGV
jgi:RNA polymerase sigma-70 factor (ECF subfamily)